MLKHSMIKVALNPTANLMSSTGVNSLVFEAAKP